MASTPCGSHLGWTRRGGYVVFLIAAVVVLMGACRRRTPSPPVLSGAWIPATDSLRYVRSSVGPESRLSLNANGSFEASRVPGEILYPRPPGATGAVTGRGRWRVERSSGGWSVELVFEAIAEGQTGAVLPYQTSVSVSEERARTRLYYYSGDADLGRRVFFERR